MTDQGAAGASSANDKLDQLKAEAEAEMGRSGPQELEGRAAKRPRFSGKLPITARRCCSVANVLQPGEQANIAATHACLGRMMGAALAWCVASALSGMAEFAAFCLGCMHACACVYLSTGLQRATWLASATAPCRSCPPVHVASSSHAAIAGTWCMSVHAIRCVLEQKRGLLTSLSTMPVKHLSSGPVWDTKC